MFSWGHLFVTYNNPSIEPRGEAVPNTELFRRLAAAMGMDDPVFRRSDTEMIAEAFDWTAPAMEGITVEGLKEKGWARLNLPGPDDYAPHREGNFRTPSGKTEFLSSAAAAGNFVVPLFRQGSNDHQPGQEVDPLPHYIPPRESHSADAELAARYPLNLISPKAHAFINSSFGNIERHQKVQKPATLIMNPADAESRGIESGDVVRAFNDRGSVTLLAKVDDATISGVTVCHLGHWRTDSLGVSTLSSLNPTRFADLGNAPTFSDTLIQVERVSSAPQ